MQFYYDRHQDPCMRDECQRSSNRVNIIINIGISPHPCKKYIDCCENPYKPYYINHGCRPNNPCDKFF